MFIFQTLTTCFSECCLFSRTYLISSRQRYTATRGTRSSIVHCFNEWFSVLSFACVQHRKYTFLPKVLHYANDLGVAVTCKEAQQSAKKNKAAEVQLASKHGCKQCRFKKVFGERKYIQQYICQTPGYTQCVLVSNSVCMYECKHNFVYKELHRDTFKT